MDNLLELERNNDFEGLIAAVKEQIKQNPRAISDPFIQSWIGRRWRNLFISEAVKDPKALRTSRVKKSGKKNSRSARQKIAERFLRGDSIFGWQDEMPAAELGKYKNVTLVFCAGLLNGLLPDHLF